MFFIQSHFFFTALCSISLSQEYADQAEVGMGFCLFSFTLVSFSFETLGKILQGMRDKTADFQNETKQPIFKTGQNSRFSKRNKMSAVTAKMKGT